MAKVKTISEWEKYCERKGIYKIPIEERIYKQLMSLPKNMHQSFFDYLSRRPKVHNADELEKEFGTERYYKMMYSSPSLRTLLNRDKFGFKISKTGPRDKEKIYPNKTNIFY
jgi:hypothetical protein